MPYKELWVSTPKPEFRKALHLFRRAGEGWVKPPLPENDYSHLPFELFVEKKALAELADHNYNLTKKFEELTERYQLLRAQIASMSERVVSPTNKFCEHSGAKLDSGIQADQNRGD